MVGPILTRHQILRTVVSLVLVDVVHLGARWKRMSERSLHDDAMGLDHPATATTNLLRQVAHSGGCH